MIKKACQYNIYILPKTSLKLSFFGRDILYASRIRSFFGRDMFLYNTDSKCLFKSIKP